MIVDFSMISIPHTAFLLTEYVRLCPIIIEIINGSHELVSMPTLFSYYFNFLRIKFYENNATYFKISNKRI